MLQISWQDRAAAKVTDPASKIPPHWRVSQEDRNRARERKNSTGLFDEPFLSKHEVAIIRLDSPALVEKLATGALKSLEVAKAYCKTAVIAHQINRAGTGRSTSRRSCYPCSTLILSSLSQSPDTESRAGRNIPGTHNTSQEKAKSTSKEQRHRHWKKLRAPVSNQPILTKEIKL